jgi:hypothetical protein
MTLTANLRTGDGLIPTERLRCRDEVSLHQLIYIVEKLVADLAALERCLPARKEYGHYGR